MRRESMTYEEKVKIIPVVCFMLDIIYSTARNGIRMDIVERVKAIEDEFLKYCYTLVVCGVEPELNKRVLNNLVENEEDDFKRIKMRIQKEAILTLQQADSFNHAIILIFSFLGMDFKNDYLNCIKNCDERIHRLIVTESCFNQYSLDETIKILNDVNILINR